MAKKTLWKDNTTPPTNYIWMRTNDNGELIGIYEYINGRWTKIDYSSAKKIVGAVVFGKDSEGNIVELPIGDGSLNFENIVGYNTEDSGATKGTITAVTPGDSDPGNTVATVEYVKQKLQDINVSFDPVWYTQTT